MKTAWIGIGFGALVSVTGAQAQQASDPLQGVINEQLQAFAAKDFDQAFGFASPMIQGIFGSAERFGQMVQQGYPMVVAPADVTYLEQRAVGDEVWQQVLIQDAAGAYHTLIYQMVDVDGDWQINGVRILEAPEVGA